MFFSFILKGSPMKNYNVVIIGGGIVGLFIAYKLSQYDLSLCLLEKNNDLLNETSAANSAIIHTGYDPKPDSLKARLNPLGHKQYKALSELLKVPYLEVGSLLLAYDQDDIKVIEGLYQNALDRSIEVSLLSRDEALKKEPLLKPCLKALYSPKTAIISPWLTGIALVENALYNGLDLYLNQQVNGLKQLDTAYIVQTDKESFKADIIFNCAGLYASTIHQLLKPERSFSINYRKGEYYVLDKQAMALQHVIYPTPNKEGKGVLLVPTVDGNVLIGPNASQVLTPNDNQTTLAGLKEVQDKAKRLVDYIPYHQTIRTFAGIRPSSSTEDFEIIMDELPHFYTLAGIDSPGLASAPAIADYCIDHLKTKVDLTLKKDWKIYPSKLDYLHQCDAKTRFNENPDYAHIVCRCEQISKQEIIEAMKSLYPALTVKGIKKRLRPHMGHCQGGFCEPIIIKLISEFTHCPLEDVLYDKLGSNILYKRDIQL